MDTAEVSIHTPSELQNIKKVPGSVAPVGRLSHEAAQFKQSIKAKSVPELKDLLNRQQKILENKSLCSKLPDKGRKVKERITLIQVGFPVRLH